LLCLGPELLDL